MSTKKNHLFYCFCLISALILSKEMVLGVESEGGGFILNGGITAISDTLEVNDKILNGDSGGILTPLKNNSFEIVKTKVPYCGDGIKNLSEQCDGSDFAGNLCIYNGFDSGTLTCTATCQIDTSTCIKNPLPSVPTPSSGSSSSSSSHSISRSKRISIRSPRKSSSSVLHNAAQKPTEKNTLKTRLQNFLAKI